MSFCSFCVFEKMFILLSLMKDPGVEPTTDRVVSPSCVLKMFFCARVCAVSEDESFIFVSFPLHIATVLFSHCLKILGNLIVIHLGVTCKFLVRKVS